MNSYINPKSIHIILDPRSPNRRSPNPQIQSPPNLSLESAGEWEKEHQHFPIKDTSNIQFKLNCIITKNSVPILSYT